MTDTIPETRAELEAPAGSVAASSRWPTASDGQPLLAALVQMERQMEMLERDVQRFAPGAQQSLTEDALTKFREGLNRLQSRLGGNVSAVQQFIAYQEPPPPPSTDTPAGESGNASPDESSPGSGSAPKNKALTADTQPADPSARLVSKTLEDEMYPVDGLSDEITNLPTRFIGEKAIDAAIATGRPRYLGVIILDRLFHITARFGNETGTEALRHCALFLSAKLPPGTLIIRWRAGAFLALFDISGTLAEARHVIEQIAIQKVKFNFLTNHRSAMLSLTFGFQIFPIADAVNFKILAWQVDDFFEAHCNRQPH